MPKNKYVALVLSGGKGLRLGEAIPKQYIKVREKMIITYCMDTLVNHNNIDDIIIVANDEWRDAVIENMSNCGMNDDKLIGFAKPGANRQESILNGLKLAMDYYGLNDKYDSEREHTLYYVLVHDAARPCVTKKQISDMIEACDGFDGVMPALPMKDTVYVSNDGSVIDGLCDRAKLFAGQAPELYELNKYYNANTSLSQDELYKINGSTEPAYIAGMDIRIIPGDENNYKITSKVDLEKFRAEIEKR